MAVCLLGAGAALARPHRPLGTFGYRSGSIYPWWTWALVVTGVLGALVVLAAPGRRAVGAAVCAVSGAMLVGTGLVAFRHWEPSSGMAGLGYGGIPQLERLALGIAALAAVATLCAGWQLLADGELRRRHWGPGSALRLLVGLATIGLLPAIVMIGDLDADRQTWGAIGLVYAGPWGAALVASAWTSRPVTLALVGSVLGCVGLAAIGPQMFSLVDFSADHRFAVVGVVVALVCVVSVRPRGRVPAGSRP